jgi:putative addiction module component (TIGR02574 family)
MHTDAWYDAVRYCLYGGIVMTPTLEELGVDRLSIQQRIALAQEILDSVAAEQPISTLSDAKRQELERRIADHAANPDDVVPWEQVETEALARFGK